MNRRTFLATATGGVCSWANASAQLAPEAGGQQHPSYAAAMSLVRDQQWRQLSSLVVSLPPQSARVLIGELADQAPLGVDFGDLPRYPMGNSIIAGIQVGWGWQSRGHGLGSTVTSTGLAGFVQNLTLARASVALATEADADDGVAHAIGFAIHKGLGDRAALYSGLRGYLMAGRRPVGGLAAFADAVSRKWLGSEDETLTFARQTYRLDLPASTGLIPDVHVTCWEARAIASTQRGEPQEPVDAYFAHPEVRQDILAASEAFNAVGPDPDIFANWYANTWLAYTLLLVNETELARPHLVAMGPYIGGPWADLPQPRQAIDSIRRRLGVESL